MGAPEIDSQPDAITTVKPVVAVGDGHTAKAEGSKAKVVHNAEFFAAVQEANIPRWSRESLKLYFAIFIAFCCACANGYDGSLMTSILDMDHFQNVFDAGKTGVKVSLIFSMYTVGSITGAPFAVSSCF